MGGNVVFGVEHQIKGLSTDKFSVNQGRTSCDIKFVVGQKWLYAGQNVFNPSILLESSIGGKIVVHQNPIRRDDSGLGLKKEWQVCEVSSSCKFINYGCSDTASNKNHYDLAKRKAIMVGGDPTAISCVSSPDNLFDLPLCVKKQMWELDV